MGIYSNTRFNSVGTSDIDVPANENYNLVTGCAMALAEGYQNDLAIFEATIRSDMAEVYAVNEGMEVINESAKDVWNKIKELFMKLLEKIKGVFKSFMARISGIFTESEKLYDRYSKVISNCKSWKSFKAKWRKPKADNIIEEISKKGQYKFAGQYTISDAQNANGPGSFKRKDILDADNVIDTSDILDEIFNSRLDDSIKNDVSKLDDINKALMDAVFNDEESVDNWNSGDFLGVTIGGLLKNQSKNRSTIDKSNTNMEYTIQKIIDSIDKEYKKITKALSDVRLGKGATYNKTQITVDNSDEVRKGHAKGTVSSAEVKNGRTGAKIPYDDEGTLSSIERVAQFYQRYANQEQAVINKLTAARLGAYKFAITQARRVFSSAAAFASVEHKNEAYEYYTAIGEAVEYDTLSDLQAV